MACRRVRGGREGECAGLIGGPGVAPELLPTIFERFARADTSRSRIAGSTGLGLAIVTAVVQAHSGTVEVTSRPGQTAFLVRLPLTDRPGPPQLATSRTRPTTDRTDAFSVLVPGAESA